MSHPKEHQFRELATEAAWRKESPPSYRATGVEQEMQALWRAVETLADGLADLFAELRR